MGILQNPPENERTISTNVKKQHKKDTNETAYYAGRLAEKLGDQKSLTYYKIVCQRIDPHKLMQKAAEIIADGGARNPGAVFAAWVKTRESGLE